MAHRIIPQKSEAGQERQDARTKNQQMIDNPASVNSVVKLREQVLALAERVELLERGLFRAPGSKEMIDVEP